MGRNVKVDLQKRYMVLEVQQEQASVCVVLDDLLKSSRYAEAFLFQNMISLS